MTELEEILDIIDSENSGLSAEQRIEEIRKVAKENLKTTEVYKRIIRDAFTVSLNCNDFFAYACAWAMEVFPEDIEWMAKFAASKKEEDFWPAVSACMAYIANREPIKPHVTETFLKFIEELKDAEQIVYTDLDYEFYSTIKEDGSYRKIKKEWE